MHFDNGFFNSFHFTHAYMNRIYACYFFFFSFSMVRLLFLFFVCFCSFRCTVHTHTCGGQCATSFQHYIFGQWSLTFRIRNAIKNILLSARHESQAINNRHTVSFEEMCTTNHVTHTLTHSLTRTKARDDKFKKPQFYSVIRFCRTTNIQIPTNVLIRENYISTHYARQSTTFWLIDMQ